MFTENIESAFIIVVDKIIASEVNVKRLNLIIMVKHENSI